MTVAIGLVVVSAVRVVSAVSEGRGGGRGCGGHGGRRLVEREAGGRRDYLLHQISAGGRDRGSLGCVRCGARSAHLPVRRVVRWRSRGSTPPYTKPFVGAAEHASSRYVRRRCGRHWCKTSQIERMCRVLGHVPLQLKSQHCCTSSFCYECSAEHLSDLPSHSFIAARQVSAKVVFLLISAQAVVGPPGKGSIVTFLDCEAQCLACGPVEAEVTALTTVEFLSCPYLTFKEKARPSIAST
ncbi:hypothetical protein BDY21DRAFT_349651 [Lineolata rhizophorae]|uniref:Secreted protein n=1 Tax=Lineolata rhizophorae TaxID=578093 RepID=A0A6A6NV10_9PEZI|nr:hypothetical protein BDY21DRAFT_349651 [Lineolata rhizophorae]